MASLEKELGIEVYSTKSPGIGGVIRESADDFVVEEVLVDGSKATINGIVSKKVLRSTCEKQKHLLCVLIKRNWDTLIAVKNIARQLGIDQSRIQIAGIKDAKALTAQHLTIEGKSIEDVSKIEIKDIRLLPVGYVREALSTYYLLGNHFTIHIKYLENKEIVENRISHIIEEIQTVGGVPNFFGHQRFGTTRPITHLVGKALVSGNFEEAAMLFLAKASVCEHASSKQVRHELRSKRDFRKALDNFPKQLRFERIILSHLVEKPGDFVGAFQQLPVKLQELFVQAHQSYFFNRFLSKRLSGGYFLNRAEIGDYVVGVERSGLPLPKMALTATAETVDQINGDITNGKMRVALPIIGLKQKLSKGVIGDLEKEVLEKEKIESKNFKANASSRVGYKGGLRAVVTPIINFNFNFSEEKGEKDYARLCFMLLRGSYATILLREIMKPQNPIAAGF